MEATTATPVASFVDAVRLFRDHGQPMLHSWLEQQASLLHFAPGEIEIALQGPSPADWPARAAALLSGWTGRPWTIRVGDGEGEPPLAVQAAERKRARILALEDDPRLRPVLDAVPGARIIDIRERGGQEAVAIRTGEPAPQAAE